jgi:hypothetical protein
MNQAFDASIPVLTEIMREDAPAPVVGPVAAAFAAANADEVSPPANDRESSGAAGLPAQDDAAAWEALERRLSEQVLHQLSSRVDFVLEQRIKDSINEVLTHALHNLTVDIRAGLHDTIGKIVSRAVQQEITHLQASSSLRK